MIIEKSRRRRHLVSSICFVVHGAIWICGLLANLQSKINGPKQRDIFYLKLSPLLLNLELHQSTGKSLFWLLLLFYWSLLEQENAVFLNFSRPSVQAAYAWGSGLLELSAREVQENSTSLAAEHSLGRPESQAYYKGPATKLVIMVQTKWIDGAQLNLDTDLR